MAENRKIRGNDIRPRRVDCEQDVTVAGASIADAASGVFIQSDEPTDPPNGARWTDTSTQPPRTKIYDDSSSAWIPINAGDRTFVQDTEPDDLLQGDIWFDTSPEDGTDMLWFDGSSLNFLQFISPIPDSGLLLDDWEDGEFDTNRNKSDPEGELFNIEPDDEDTYFSDPAVRPEWTNDVGSVSVSDGVLQLDPDDSGIIRPFDELNESDLTSETVTWELKVESVEVENDDAGLSMFSSSDNRRFDDGGELGGGYSIRMRDTFFDIREIPEDGGSTDLSGGVNYSDGDVIKVVRDSDGNWEVFVNGNSESSFSDTAHTDPNYVGFYCRGGSEAYFEWVSIY